MPRHPSGAGGGSGMPPACPGRAGYLLFKPPLCGKKENHERKNGNLAQG